MKTNKINITDYTAFALKLARIVQKRLLIE